MIRCHLLRCSGPFWLLLIASSACQRSNGTTSLPTQNTFPASGAVNASATPGPTRTNVFASQSAEGDNGLNHSLARIYWAQQRTPYIPMPSAGRSDASQIFLVEFTDYTCELCNEYASRLAPAVRKTIAEDLDGTYVQWDIPSTLRKGEVATAIAASAFCGVDDDTFWKLRNEIVSRGRRASRVAPRDRQAAIDLVLDTAREADLLTDQLAACAQQQLYESLVRSFRIWAVTIGITEAPAFAVVGDDGEFSVLQGFAGYEDLANRLAAAVRLRTNVPELPSWPGLAIGSNLIDQSAPKRRPFGQPQVIWASHQTLRNAAPPLLPDEPLEPTESVVGETPDTDSNARPSPAESTQREIPECIEARRKLDALRRSSVSASSSDSYNSLAGDFDPKLDLDIAEMEREEESELAARVRKACGDTEIAIPTRDTSNDWPLARCEQQAVMLIGLINNMGSWKSEYPVQKPDPEMVREEIEAYEASKRDFFDHGCPTYLLSSRSSGSSTSSEVDCPVYGAPSEEGHCFGAVGINCVGGTWWSTVEELIGVGCTHVSGSIYRCPINAGSWFHDTCCEGNREGHNCCNSLWCRANFWAVCAKEWHIAIWSVVGNLSWIRNVNGCIERSSVDHERYAAPAGARLPYGTGDPALVKAQLEGVNVFDITPSIDPFADVCQSRRAQTTSTSSANLGELMECQ